MHMETLRVLTGFVTLVSMAFLLGGLVLSNSWASEATQGSVNIMPIDANAMNKAGGCRPPSLSSKFEYAGMVLACPCLALQALTVYTPPDQTLIAQSAPTCFNKWGNCVHVARPSRCLIWIGISLAQCLSLARAESVKISEQRI